MAWLRPGATSGPVNGRRSGPRYGLCKRGVSRALEKLFRKAKADTGRDRPRNRLDTIYRIAIGHALTKAFVPPTTAMSLAQLFFEPQRGRKRGSLFESGKTLLLVSDGASSICNLQIDEDISMHLHEATIVVDLGKIISTVNSRLVR
jgi:hypothetical protein